jgi:hypothetical protein
VLQPSPLAESERLRRKIEAVVPRLVAASRRVVEHPRVADVYPEFLFTSHCIIRASVPLMEMARDRARELPREDGVAPALAGYLDHHIPEELDHDEWLLDDLETLGIERATILARPPTPTVAALVGAQYYWLLHYHPVAVLGYIGVLEGYPPSVELVQELIARTGYDERGFRTLRKHAELDPGHREELNEFLDTLPLANEQAAVMGLSAMHTVNALSAAYDELV